MIIKGKAVFKCPRTGEEVRLDKECINLDGKGDRCPFLRHWSWEGSRPIISCSYKDFQQYSKDVERDK